MVAGAFKFAEYPGRFQAQAYGGGVFRGIAGKGVYGLAVQLVEYFVFFENRLGHCDVLGLQCLVRCFEHVQHRVVHFLELQPAEEFLVFGFYFGSQHEAGNAVGIVAYAFEVGVYFQHGQGEAQVYSHGVVEGYAILDVAVDFELEGVYPFFARNHFVGQLFVGVQHRLVCVFQLLVNQCPHLADFCAYGLQFIFYEFYHCVVLF